MSSPDQHGVVGILQSSRSQDPRARTATKEMSTSASTLLSEPYFSSTGVDQCLPQLGSHELASSIMKRGDISGFPRQESDPSQGDLLPAALWTYSGNSDTKSPPTPTIDLEQIWSRGSMTPPPDVNLSPTLENQRKNTELSIQGSDPSQREFARDHPLYKNASLSTDGLYHCPWEGQESCNHKPDKLKCVHDKYVDSHLKPYRCRDSACSDMQFSSTACLLRHERETHAMHGHGSKPFFCSYEGCDRAIPGKGFPRLWNLRDHMRRMHNNKGASECRSDNRQIRQPKRRGKSKAVLKANSTEANGQTERSLTEEWIIQRNSLEALLLRLNQPQDPQSSRLIEEAQVHLLSMKTIFLSASHKQKRQSPERL